MKANVAIASPSEMKIECPGKGVAATINRTNATISRMVTAVMSYSGYVLLLYGGRLASGNGLAELDKLLQELHHLGFDEDHEGIGNA